jgi:hypothetical protein
MSINWQPPDFDEVRPDRFIIHNDKLRPFLKGEGVTAGKFFELVTWRREGLLARLQTRGFNVRTLADRIAALPVLPVVHPPGPIGVRALSHPKERIAIFDQQHLHWRDLPIEDQHGKPIVRMQANQALRRRKSRGHADYYTAILVHGGQINLLPIKETDALLHAYAQIALNDLPASIQYIEQVDAYFVPQRQAILPPPHREILNLLSKDNAERWTIPLSAKSMAKEVFAKLGLRLQGRS